MKILQLSNKSPWPPQEGGPIAMNALVSGLQQEGHEVHILTMSTDKYPVDLDRIPASYIQQTSFQKVYVDSRIHLWKAFLNLFSGASYNISRFISEDYDSKLKSILSAIDYEVVILESLYVTPYIETIRKYSGAKIILRAHNIEHRIWQRLTRASKNPLKKAYLNLLAKRLFIYEKSVLNKVDGIAAITENDAHFFSENASNVKIEVVPFGILPEQYIFTPQDGRNISLCHIGSMDWMPNQEGILWFLNKCWPGIHGVFPDLKLTLAGRNMPGRIKNHGWPGVEVVGEVEDAASFITNHPVMMVPLLSGSGVRVKIIEAMALGRTVITTHTGAEGIRYTDGEDILIADTPVGLYEKIKFCIKNPEQCAQIGQKARKMIETHHNSMIATSAMLKLIRSI